MTPDRSIHRELPPRRGLAHVLIWMGLIGLGVGTVMLHAMLADVDPRAGRNREFFTLVAGLFAIYILAAELVRRRALGGVLPTVWAFLVAAASLTVYLPSEVLLSSEVHRFRWEGRVATEGFNPYQVSPSDPEVVALRAEFDAPVPGPGTRGIYPPLAELLFYAMSRTGTDSVPQYRMLFILAALAAGLALLPLLRGLEAPMGRVLIFLWHPVLVIETAGNGHMEAFPLLFLLISLGMLYHGHHISPMGSLGLATLAKAFPLAILPLYLRRVPWYRWILFFLVVAVGTAPFLGAGRQLWTGFFAYLAEARFNPGGYLAAEALLRELGRPEWTRPAVAALGGLVAVVLYASDSGSPHSVLRRALYLSLPPLLLGPVVQPWYLIWITPFLALLATRNLIRFPLLYLSASVLLVYGFPEDGAIPTWVPWVEFAPPVVVILGIAITARLRSRRWRHISRSASTPVGTGSRP